MTSTSPGPYAPPGWGMQPPPPRRPNRLGWIIGGAVALGLVVCAGGATIGLVVRHKVAADDAAPANWTAVGGLAADVIPAPKDSRPWATEPRDQQLTGLDLASGTFANASVYGQVLNQYRFEQGYARRWVDDKGTIVDVRLFQFDNYMDAGSFMSYVDDDHKAQFWSSPAPLTAAGVSYVQTAPRPDGNGRFDASGVVNEDDEVVLIDIQQPPPKNPRQPADRAKPTPINQRSKPVFGTPSRGTPATMFPAENLRDWRGEKVIDPDGGKIGELEAVYVDTSTDEPSFATVRVGIIGRHRLVFVPLQGATVSPSAVRVRFPKKLVSDSPSIDVDGELTAAEEPQVFAHYQLSYATGAAGERRLARR